MWTLGHLARIRDEMAVFLTQLKEIHGAWCRSNDDLAVAIVHRVVAGAVKAAHGRQRIQGFLLRVPLNGAPQVGTLPVQRQKTLRDAREKELSLHERGDTGSVPTWGA